MSIKDLTAKFSQKFSSTTDDLKNHVDENFGRIIKIIFISGATLVVLIVVIAFFTSKGSTRRNESLKSPKMIATDNRQEILETLINDELLLPTNHTFEVSDDYIDFMILKEYTPPRIDMVIKDYQSVLEDAVENELKFNFEMRGKNAKTHK